MRPRLGGQCDRKSRGGRFLFLTSVLNESSRQHKFDSHVDAGPTKSKTTDKNSTRIGLGKSARIRWISALSSGNRKRHLLDGISICLLPAASLAARHDS